MKKAAGKKILFILAALMLVGSTVLCGCSKKETEIKSMQKARKIISDPADKGTTADTGTAAPAVELTPGKKPVRSSGDWKSIAESGFTYDIKVTTFNVGNFYHGVTNLNVYEAQKVHPGITPERIQRAYGQWQTVIEEFETDILGMQEFHPIFYRDTEKDVEIKAEDAFDSMFKKLNMYTGHTASGTLDMYMAMGSHKNSQFELTDITTGYLSGRDEQIQRAYMKGYTTVKGKRIAVFCVHLHPKEGSEGDAWRKDAAYELIDLMSQEEYAIAMGDMNGNMVTEYMKEAGLNAANMGEFGNFSTYEYRDTLYLDNIYTTSNIDIQYVECEKIFAGASDHYPLSAYLKINDDANNLSGAVQVDEDGFIDGWYRP